MEAAWASETVFLHPSVLLNVVLYAFPCNLVDAPNMPFPIPSWSRFPIAGSSAHVALPGTGTRFLHLGNNPSLEPRSSSPPDLRPSGRACSWWDLHFALRLYMGASMMVKVQTQGEANSSSWTPQHAHTSFSSPSAPAAKTQRMLINVKDTENQKKKKKRKWTKTFLFKNRWLFGPKLTDRSERNVFSFLFSFFLFCRMFSFLEDIGLLFAGATPVPHKEHRASVARPALFERRDIYPRQTMRQLQKVCQAMPKACSVCHDGNKPRMQTKLSLQEFGWSSSSTTWQRRSLFFLKHDKRTQDYKPQRFLGSTPRTCSRFQCSMTEKLNFF